MRKLPIQWISRAQAAAVTISCARAAVQLLGNGGFETGDATGWTITDQNNGTGSYFTATVGEASPLFGFPTTPGAESNGKYYAISDQTAPGVRALTQDFTIPAASGSVMLAFDMFVNSYGGGQFNSIDGLDYQTDRPNQYARVDLLTSDSEVFDTGSGVIANFYLGVDSVGEDPNPFSSYSIDITGLVVPGGSYKIRFAEVDNMGILNHGVDNVSIISAARPMVPDAGGTLLMLGLSLASVSGIARFHEKARH